MGLVWEHNIIISHRIAVAFYIAVRSGNVDDKQKRKEAHNVLLRYRSLRRMKAENELDKIDSAFKNLSKIDKEIIKRKYFQIDIHTNIRIYTEMFMSESKFYRYLNNALLHFYEAY